MKHTFFAIFIILFLAVSISVPCGIGTISALDLGGMFGGGNKDKAEVKGGQTESQFNLTELFDPINKKYVEVRKRIDEKFPNKEGMIGAAFWEYSKKGKGSVVIANSDKEDTKAEFTIFALCPQTISGNGKLQNEIYKDDIIEIMTIDKKAKSPLKKVYMLGDNSFDLIYMTKLGLAIKQTKEKVSKGGLAAIGAAKDAKAAAEFTANLLGILGDMAKGGSKLMSQNIAMVTGALNNPDPKVVASKGDKK